MKIAVIGGGIFGCTAALRLARDGHSVTVFDRADRILAGASFNNQNRLHLGYHYPRHLATARQCREGFERFRTEFASCLRSSFPNAYFIASEGSLTSADGFRSFCEAAELPWRPVPRDFVPHVTNVAPDGGTLTEELVFDAGNLGAEISRRMPQAGIRVFLGPVGHVTHTEKLGGGGYHLICGGIGRCYGSVYDAVVNCTYAAQNDLADRLGYAPAPRQYEYTAIAIVEADLPPCGVTIMDGPFGGILPFGRSSEHLLYHVAHSVIARHDGVRMPRAWAELRTAPFAAVDRTAWFARLRADLAHFVPAIERANLVGVLEGPRVVLARREATDARPSFVTAHAPDYLTVFAGKVDHCLEAADDVAAKLGGIESRAA